MAYVVTAGYVTVETELPGGRRAHVDVRRGETLPADVPQAQIDWELKLNTIELVPKPEPTSTAEEAAAVTELADPNAMPTGLSVSATQTWVGADRARAEVALAAENAAASPRSTLVARLQAVLDAE